MSGYRYTISFGRHVSLLYVSKERGNRGIERDNIPKSTKIFQPSHSEESLSQITDSLHGLSTKLVNIRTV